jgi:hypothetical protein
MTHRTLTKNLAVITTVTLTDATALSLARGV